MNIKKTWISFTILWGIFMYTLTIKLNTLSNVKYSRTLHRINMVLKQLNDIRPKTVDLKIKIENNLNDNHNASLNTLINKLNYQLEYVKNVLDDKDYFKSATNKQPSSEYEQLRRGIRQNTREIWNYFSSELGKTLKFRENGKVKNEISKEIDNIFELSAEYKRSVISNIDSMYLVDGYGLWRQKTAEHISNLVQKQLHSIQNPKDCSNSKKFLCSISQACGFGCQIHHVLYCFIEAYAKNRTFLITTETWNYKGNWQAIFQPISETCLDFAINDKTFKRRSLDSKLLFFADIYLFGQDVSFLPLAIPDKLAPILTKLQGDPSVWWISQFLKYLFKPTDKIEKMIKMNMEKSGWKKPIVGIHIRRTDKVSEADYHSIEQYMTHVEDYYLTLEMNNKNVIRRIFIATDDPHVITEARTNYPLYTVIGNLDVAERANISTRYTNSSLVDIISDIHMLSLSDYLVCTFSSQVCRVAYEIMQNYYTDASERIQSLDDIYFFPQQNEHYVKAILLHKKRNEYEIRIKSGDFIHYFGNELNGFSKGKNNRTYKIGLFPSFKVKNVIEIFHLSRLYTDYEI